MFSLPLILVLGAAVVIVHYYFKLEKLRTTEKRLAENSFSMLKIRLLAYERLILFLERISPPQLVLRHSHNAISVSELHGILLENIRDEYEHNLVQQLYISAEGWAKIEQARLWVLQLVNESAGSLQNIDGGNGLLTAIIEKSMKSKSNKVQVAIDLLKNEVRELF